MKAPSSLTPSADAAMRASGRRAAQRKRRPLRSGAKKAPAQSGAVRIKTVAVVGLGYVGLPLALLVRAGGFRVYGIDASAQKCRAIRSGAAPDLSAEEARALRDLPLAASNRFDAASGADLIIVCVPTPVDKRHNPDLRPVLAAARSIGAHLRRGALVVLESTVHPGTCEEIFIPALEASSGLAAGIDFGVAHCPERINPGDAAWPLARIPRVIGATSPQALAAAAGFYRSILSAPVREMASIREAEAVKVVENAFRDINIAFVNELAMSFDKLGIDVLSVLDGAATKPFGFMRHLPGCGVGGHCIPVDPYYLIRYAKKNGFSHRFLSLARSINERMPSYAVSILSASLAAEGRGLRGAAVALLGMSYKAGVGDVRESPSLAIKELLKRGGAAVRTYDAYASDYSSAGSIAEALAGADAAIVATAHPEFVSLPPHAFLSRGVSIVIDGRNCLPKERYLAAGVAYRGIGR